MADLMCPTRLVCLRHGGTLPALAGLQVGRVYSAPESLPEAERLAGDLGVDAEVRPALAEVADAPLRSWLLDAELETPAADGRTGRYLLDRVGSTLTEIAERHRGQTVAVVAGAAPLSLALAALCRGLAPAVVCRHPLTPGRAVITEYDADGWRYLSGWTATTD
ncbi:MAG: histidine phosphatase family protein [Actinocatenispora sp.]